MSVWGSVWRTRAYLTRGPVARPCLQVSARTALCLQPLGRGAECAAGDPSPFPAGAGPEELLMFGTGRCLWDAGGLVLQ